MNISINDLYQDILIQTAGQETVLIAIDGGGGAGKSTLAQKLKEVDAENVSVIHMDDFYKPSEQRKHVTDSEIGGNWDCERVKAQVLVPLSTNQPTSYQRYDWVQDALAEFHDVPSGHVVIVEGCYSLLDSLRPFYQFKIWVQSPRDVRLSRGIDRDGEEQRHLWENLWMPAEEVYIKAQNPMEAANLIIDGTGRTSEIENFEVTVLKKNDGGLDD